jgi:hypothetical protein
MQTFLPYPSFRRSVECLDYRRLGKQRVEAFQLLVANGDKWAVAERTRRTGKSGAVKGWINHPAAIMWRGHSPALSQYYNLCIKEWVRREYNNTMQFAPLDDVIEHPRWLGDEVFHAAHRSNLLRKNPEYYSQFDWLESDNHEYVWPLKND